MTEREELRELKAVLRSPIDWLDANGWTPAVPFGWTGRTLQRPHETLRAVVAGLKEKGISLDEEPEPESSEPVVESGWVDACHDGVLYRLDQIEHRLHMGRWAPGAATPVDAALDYLDALDETGPPSIRPVERRKTSQEGDEK